MSSPPFFVFGTSWLPLYTLCVLWSHLLIKKKKKSLILFKFDNTCELKRVLLLGNSRLEGKALRLDWWNPDVGCLRVKDCVKEVWMGVLGLPLHFWGEQFFKRLGDACGCFITVDEETRERRLS